MCLEIGGTKCEWHEYVYNGAVLHERMELIKEGAFAESEESRGG